MAFVRITDINKDLPVLNDALASIADLQQFVNEQRQQNQALAAKLQTISQQKGTTSTNNLQLTWTGSTLKFSWPAAFVRDAFNNYFPIPAGTSQALLASTNYWVGWNAAQQQMSFQVNLNLLTSIVNELIVCQIFSGTAGQSGSAGGGGTDPGGTSPVLRSYKLF
jgi:hypothetical protein